jgi:hypothetical protein
MAEAIHAPVHACKSGVGWLAVVERGCFPRSHFTIIGLFHGGDSGECVTYDMSDGSCHSCSSTCMQQYMHALGPGGVCVCGEGGIASESCSMEVLSQQAVLQVDWI